MGNKVLKLCKDCKAAANSDILQPRHLVHPRTGELMLFDIYGHAKCPACEAVWKRTAQGLELADQASPQ